MVLVRHSVRQGGVIASLAVLALFGCARAAAPASAPVLQSAAEGRALPVLDGRGEVLVGARLVERCAAVHDAPEGVAPTVLLGALAECLVRGELRDGRVVVIGTAASRVFVRHALASLGIASERVDGEGPLDEDDCIDECDARDRRVTIELASP